MLLAVGLQLFIHPPREFIFWLMAVVFVLAAILFFTMLFGALISRLTSDAGVLTVRWNTKIFKKHIRIDQIAEITEDKNFIRIIQKDGKIIRLPVRLMEPDRRRAVRKFLKEVTGF